jgi:glycosyltransferase involved in cell wall biosynthesis
MLEQLRELRDRYGYEITAVIGGTGSLAAKLAAEGIRTLVFEFGFPANMALHRLLTQVSALARLLDGERFDIVQTHLFSSMVLTRLAAWLADVPVRLAMIAGPFHLEADTPRWIDAHTAWMETGVIGSCAYTLELYRRLRLPPSHLHLVYYGPDDRKFDPARVTRADVRSAFGWSADAPVVGMVAYFYPKLPPSRWTPAHLHDRANKRQEDLLHAIPMIRATVPEARFLFIGSGWGELGRRNFAEAQALALQLGLNTSVAFAGFRRDVAEILAAIDVSVQASLSENLGGTIEALLMECPIVATRTGGMIDSVRHEETGLLVPPMDVPALAEAVTRLLLDPSRAKALGRNGRKLMLAKFTLGRAVDDLHKIYREQLEGHGTAERGYRWRVRLLRRALAIPVFAYLGGRLVADVVIRQRWENLRRRLHLILH